MKSKIPGRKPELPLGCARVAIAASFLFGTAIGLLFLVGGSAAVVLLVGDSLRERWASRGWVESTCTIVASAVLTRPGADGPVSSANIRYEYQAGGRRFEGERLLFGSGPMSSAEALVAAHPLGSRSACYHDPTTPERAVLERRLGGPTLIIAFGGGSFALVGLVAIAVVAATTFFGSKQLDAATHPKISATDSAPASVAPAAPVAPTLRSPSAVSPRSLALRADPTRFSPGLGLMLSAVWTLFTIGIFGPGLYLTTGTWERGFVALFSTPFLLIGLGFGAYSLRELLKSQNPRPQMTLAREVRLGDRCSIEWTIEGRAAKLRRLRIVVQALERATYSRGTSSYTDERVFFTHELLDSDAPDAMRGGALALAIPRETMPSFASEHNAVVWRVRVTGEIPRWPDLDATFPFEVLPPGRSAER